MHKITFISTMHKSLGKCNVDELCKVLEDERPEVAFLEALENTYSHNDRTMFSSFRVYHQKLEIEGKQRGAATPDVWALEANAKQGLNYPTITMYLNRMRSEILEFIKASFV